MRSLFEEELKIVRLMAEAAGTESAMFPDCTSFE